MKKIFIFWPLQTQSLRFAFIKQIYGATVEQVTNYFSGENTCSAEYRENQTQAFCCFLWCGIFRRESSCKFFNGLSVAGERTRVLLVIVYFPNTLHRETTF
jgi:hypothetical protein